MTKGRKGMSPITTKIILFFLKYTQLWTLRDVVEGEKRRVAADKESRAEMRVAEANTLENLMDGFGLEDYRSKRN